MTDGRQYDEGLEEIWRIKREIAAEYPTLDDYFMGMMAYQEEQKRQECDLSGSRRKGRNTRWSIASEMISALGGHAPVAISRRATNDL